LKLNNTYLLPNKFPEISGIKIPFHAVTKNHFASATTCISPFQHYIQRVLTLLYQSNMFLAIDSQYFKSSGTDF